MIKYCRVKRSCDIICDLKNTLKKIIDTLKIYQRLFYLALVTLLIAMASAFVTGLFKGLQSGMQEQGLIFSDVPPNKILLVILSAVLKIAIIRCLLVILVLASIPFSKCTCSIDITD